MASDIKTLVNACGAKTGGARIILRELVRNIPCSGYLVVCPKPEDLRALCPLAEFLDIETNGLSSLNFTLFGAAKLASAKRCKNIISLMNFNVLSNEFRRFTYFHQLKAVDGILPKELLQRFLLKRTASPEDLIICQTPYILSRLQEFAFRAKLEAHWPGFENESAVTSRTIANSTNKSRKFHFLVPSSSLAPYKNIQSIIDKEQFFNSVRANVTITGADAVYDIGPIHLMPAVPRSELFDLYAKVDAVIFPSLLETVALPVFEFLQTGKPVFLLKSPYTLGLFERFNKVKNLHLYEHDLQNAISHWISAGCEISEPRSDFSKGDWEWLPR